MDYAISSLRENHAGWSLLCAQNAPLAVSFFIKAFTGPNQQDIGHRELSDHLDDVYSAFATTSAGQDSPPASGTLNEWAGPEEYPAAQILCAGK
jgi:hypothetical protein